MTGIGHRIAPARFVLFVVLLAVAAPVGVAMLGWRHGLPLGFDIAAVAFLLSLVPLFRGSGAEDMRERSKANDANRTELLGITGAVMLVVLTAIAAEVMDKGEKAPAAVALIVGTLAIAWLFSNMVYALHYAHIYYLEKEEGGGDRGGLDIPGCDEPDYWDFAYFAFTLGMTFQTSDVEITARGVRRVALFQCLAAFVFNIGVLAFSVNVLGGG